MKRELESKDIVRIKNMETGVVNRVDPVTLMVSVFRTKHGGFATWFFSSDLKRIGRVK